MLSLIGSLVGKIFGKMVMDKDKNLEAQASINAQEVATSGVTRLKAWRGFIGWICGIIFACITLIFPILMFFFPTANLPDFTPYLEMVFRILLGMLALG